MKDGSILILEWVASGPHSGGNFRGKIWILENQLMENDSSVPLTLHSTRRKEKAVLTTVEIQLTVCSFIALCWRCRMGT